MILKSHIMHSKKTTTKNVSSIEMTGGRSIFKSYINIM